MAASITLSLDSKPAIAALQAYSRAMAGEMQNTERQVKSAGDKIFTFNQAWDATAKVLGKVKQAFELVNAAFQQVVVKTAAADEQLGAFAQSIFSSVENATKLDLIGKRFNITQEQMAQGLKGLTNKLYEANNGSAEAQLVFDKLGIRIKDMNTGALKPANDVLFEVADKFQKMGASSEKSALAIKLFEEGGLKLIPLLNQGSAGIQGMGKWFENLGITATESSVKMGTEFSRNWRTLEIMFDGTIQTLGRKLMPAFVLASEAAVKYGADLIQRIDWEKVINYIGLFTKGIGFATSAMAGFSVPFFAVADAIQVVLMGALTAATAAISKMYSGISSGLKSAGDLAAKLGRDGLAKDLRDGAADLDKFASSIDNIATDIAEKSLDFHDAGVSAILTMNDVGKGAMKLGDDMRKPVAETTKAVKETASAIDSVGKSGKGAVEILRGNVEPAVKSLDTAMKSASESTAKMVEATKGGVNPALKETDKLATGAAGAFDKFGASMENNVAVMRGLGREVPRTLEALGVVQSSLSNAMNYRVSAGGKAVGVTGFSYAGKLGDNPIPSYQQLLKSGKGAGGGWGDPGYGSITGGFNNDPFLSAFAMSNPGAATDLLTGRANAITGDRYNQYVQDLINEPYNQAAGDWMREQAAAQQEARMRSSQETAARLNAQQAAGMAKVAEAEEAARTRTGSSFDSTIPTSVDTTIAKVKELEQAFRQVNAAVETADQTMARLAENAARSVFRTTENIAPGVLSTSGARPGIIQQQLATNNPAAKLVASIQNPSVSSYGGNQSYDSIMTRGLVR